MANSFTPEQIAEILEEFFNTVGTRQYIGARYVPIFGRKDEDSIEWDNNGAYEPLTIVLYQGNSYTSRQYVPVGVEITNQAFWALTGNYNAQVEQYRRETAATKVTADSALEAAGNAQETADSALEAAGNAQQAADNAQADVDTLLPKSAFGDGVTVKSYIDEKFDIVDGSGISFESGYTDNDFYTIFTVPKDKFTLKLDLVSDSANTPLPIDAYARNKAPYLCMNISNTEDFVFNGVLHGTSSTQTVHGSIYALDDDSTDFVVFESGESLNSVIAAGYKYAISSWNMLRENGVDKSVDYAYSTYANPNPRQTLAWDDANWYIYTSYSRISLNEQNGTYRNLYGKTMRQVLDFCKERGWPNVAAFDGGGSAFVASGQPYRQLSKNINNGYWRKSYLCVAFNVKE